MASGLADRTLKQCDPIPDTRGSLKGCDGKDGRYCFECQEDFSQIKDLHRKNGQSILIMGSSKDCEREGLQKITSLDSLSELQTLESLCIVDTHLDDLSALRNLRKVTRGLEIRSNTALTSLAGLDALETVRNLRVIGNSLESLHGMEGLVQVRGILEICSNAVLTSLSGLRKLTSASNITISNNTALLSFGISLGNLESEALEIMGNSALTSLQGLENLTDLLNLTIIENSALTSLKGLDNLQRLDHLIVRGNFALSSLQGLESLEGKMDTLEIIDNPILDSLDALKNVVGPTFITIRHNSANLSLSGIEKMEFASFVEIENMTNTIVGDLLCPAGYRGFLGLKPCHECENGKYASDLGSVTCLPCGLGNISGVAAATCEPCSFLEFPNDDNSVCIDSIYWLLLGGIISILPFLYLCIGGVRWCAFLVHVRQALKIARKLSLTEQDIDISEPPAKLDVFYKFRTVYDSPLKLFLSGNLRSCIEACFRITNFVIQKNVELAAFRREDKQTMRHSQTMLIDRASQQYGIARAFIDKCEQLDFKTLMKLANDAEVRDYESKLEYCESDVEKTLQMYKRSFLVKTFFFDPLLKSIARRQHSADKTFLKRLVLWIVPCLGRALKNVRLAAHKSIVRVAEKTALRPGTGLIWDAVRGMFVGDVKALNYCMDKLLEEARRGRIVIVGINNRFDFPTRDNWQDLAVYIMFCSRIPGVRDIVCEIQMVHTRFLEMRAKYGAHDAYESNRFVAELRKQQDGREQAGLPDSIARGRVTVWRKSLNSDRCDEVELAEIVND